MQPAPPLHHRRLARINAFIARQDRIVYTLLVVVAAIGLGWVVWRHQYLAYREQHSPKGPVKALPLEKTPR